MAKHTAIRMHVEVGADRSVQLPDEVPTGPAEVIVLMNERPNGGLVAARGLLGLFADDPAAVDEAMVHVREQRSHDRRSRPTS